VPIRKMFLLERLALSAQRYLGSLENISEEDARITPTLASWSIRDVTEHVALAEKGMFAALLRGSDTDTMPDFSKDAFITSLIPDRTQRQEAPERSRPTGRYPSLGLAAVEFREAREKTVKYVAEATFDLRRISVTHPLLGELDGYQLLCVMALHPERHIGQIDEIKTSAPYLRMRS
jgi:uncharacterized damage-inducible protein DinB